MNKEYMEMIRTIDNTASEIEMLEIAISILDNLTNRLYMETDRDKYNYNRLITCLITLTKIFNEEVDK